MITRSDDGPDFDPDDPLAVILRPGADYLGPPPGRYEAIRRGAARRRLLRAAAGAGLTCAVAALVALPLRLATPQAPASPAVPLAPPPASSPSTSPTPSASAAPATPSPSTGSRTESPSTAATPTSRTPRAGRTGSATPTRAPSATPSSLPDASPSAR